MCARRSALDGGGASGRVTGTTQDPAAGGSWDRCRSNGRRPARNAPVHGHRMTPAVVWMMVRREPVPRAKVSKAGVHAERSIVSGHEPPNARVVIPSRLHEDIVHAFDDTVTVHPKVLTIAVGPVPIDPNPFGTTDDGLLLHDGPRRRRRGLRGRDGLGLLNDNDSLAADLLGRAGLGLDDHVGRRIVGLARLPFSHVAIVSNIELITGRGAVAVRPVVVCRRRDSGHRRDRQCKHRREPNEGIHSSSFICTSASPCRHPPFTERARPARQSG